MHTGITTICYICSFVKQTYEEKKNLKSMYSVDSHLVVK